VDGRQRSRQLYGFGCSGGGIGYALFFEIDANKSDVGDSGLRISLEEGSIFVFGIAEFSSAIEVLSFCECNCPGRGECARRHRDRGGGWCRRSGS
jgi:hypothetical protein